MSGDIQLLTDSLERYKGKFFSSHTVSGTAVSGAATSSTDPPPATTGLISIYNTASRTGSSGQNTIIIPLYIRIKINTVGTAGSASKLILSKDTIKRYSSGGTALTTNQTRAGMAKSGAVDPTTAKAEIYTGALVLAAASASYQVGRADIHPSGTSFFAGDIIELQFGDFGRGNNLMPTKPAKYSFGMTPVFLEPTTSLIIQTVIAGQTAASWYDVEVGHVEIKNGAEA